MKNEVGGHKTKVARRIFLSLTVIALAALVAIFAMACYDACENCKESADKYCAAKSVGPFFLRETKEALHEYGEAITALATIIISLFTWYLVDSTEKLWRAGEKQLEHSERFAKQQLRAYVGVIDKRLVVTTSEIRAEITIKNFGQTPAHGVNIEFGSGALKPPVAAELSITFQRDPWNETAFVIHPGETVSIIPKPEARIPNSAELIAEIQSEAKAVFVTGKITYKDCFGDPWVTNFLFWCCGREAFIRGWQLSAYRLGNGAT